MSNESHFHEFPDVDNDMVRIDTGPDILGAHKGAVAELHVVGPWCPNALQLLALRDRCSEILGLAVDTNVDERLTITLTENAVLSEFNASASGQATLEDALDSLGDGVVVDKVGNLCLTSGEVVAVADPDRIVWLQRIAAIVNAVIEARKQ